MKIHKRLCSWRALGFIQQLELGISDKCKVLESQIDAIGTQFGPDELPPELRSGDRTLADFFLKNKNFLKEMAKEVCCSLPNEVRSGLHLSFDAFGNAADLALGKKEALYTKENILVFHSFLYFSFLLAGRALRDIKDSQVVLCPIKSTSQRYATAADHYKKSIEAAELPVRFLICMLSSNALHLHLTVWTNNGVTLRTILPDFACKKTYVTYGLERSFLASSKLGPNNSRDEADEGEDVEPTEDEITEVRQPI